MKVLAIDSSSFPASTAVVEDGKIKSQFYINTGLTHSQTLMPMIDDSLSIINLNINDIDLIAVTVGPGSFTGVRIGVSVAKGLAMNKDIPCIGLSALEVLAYNYSGFSEDKIIFACMDARCGQVYNAVFEVVEGNVRRLNEDRAIKISELMLEVENFEGQVTLVGDGAQLCLNNSPDIGAVIAPEQLRYQMASSVAFAALASFNKKISAAELQPLYLQLPQAQRELNAKNLNKG